MPALPSPRTLDELRSDTLSDAVRRAHTTALGLGAALNYMGMQHQAPDGKPNGPMPLYNAITRLTVEVDDLATMLAEFRDYIEMVKKGVGIPSPAKHDDIPL